MSILRAALRDPAADPPRPAHEVSRLEGLTDAVFAFAITLLIVSLEVPRSYEQLMETMQGFAAFAASFTLLAGIWFFHYKFFRDFGLVDGVVIVLNLVLLFLILFYTYPLKFFVTLLINYFVLQELFGLRVAGELAIEFDQVGTLMTVYGIGFLLICLVFTLLYLHAYRKRDALGLDAEQVANALSGAGAFLICAAMAIVSLAILALMGSGGSAWAGWSYAAIGPLQGVHAWWRARGARRVAVAAA